MTQNEHEKTIEKLREENRRLKEEVKLLHEILAMYQTTNAKRAEGHR